MSEIAQRRAGHGARLRRVIAIVMVFVVVGPPIGGIVLTLATAFLMKGDLSGLSWVGLLALIYALPFSYLFGAVPAAVVGLLVGIRQAYFGSITWPFTLALGVAAGFGLVFLLGLSMTPPSGEKGALLAIIAPCLAGTLACWAIVRTWYFDSIRTAGVSA